jgi:hypothetical protein
LVEVSNFELPIAKFLFKLRGARNMSTPSTTIVSNLKNVTTPTANTMKAADIAGIDMNGMLALAETKALELKSCLTLMARVTDGADPNLATLNDVLASLV